MLQSSRIVGHANAATTEFPMSKKWFLLFCRNHLIGNDLSNFPIRLSTAATKNSLLKSSNSSHQLGPLAKANLVKESNTRTDNKLRIPFNIKIWTFSRADKRRRFTLGLLVSANFKISRPAKRNSKLARDSQSSQMSTKILRLRMGLITKCNSRKPKFKNLDNIILVEQGHSMNWLTWKCKRWATNQSNN
jgi:hypothetical protein